jgi:hypothetical protein
MLSVNVRGGIAGQCATTNRRILLLQAILADIAQLGAEYLSST